MKMPIWILPLSNSFEPVHVEQLIQPKQPILLCPIYTVLTAFLAAILIDMGVNMSQII